MDSHFQSTEKIISDKGIHGDDNNGGKNWRHGAEGGMNNGDLTARCKWTKSEDGSSMQARNELGIRRGRLVLKF